MNNYIKVNKEDLITVLLCFMANDNLSAHPVALKERKINRQKAINELLYMLNMTIEEAEFLYSKERN